MKIGPLDTKVAPLAPAPERKAAASPASGTPPAAAEPSARVELSPATVQGDGTFDSAKVERIAQAIREGKFTVNAEAIAEKLIANAEELLGRGRPSN
jgi:negative regulator of flagellin synthesis FlgM